MENKVNFKSQYGYLEALEALKPKWAHLWMNDKLMNEDNLPLNFQYELMTFLLGFNHLAKKHDLILHNGMSYHDIVNSARQIHVGELQHVTIIDTLRQLIVELKDRELYWDVRYHQLENAIDSECDTDKLQAIYERMDEPYESRVNESAFIMAKNSRNWNKQHREGLEAALMKIASPNTDRFMSGSIAIEALKKHSLKYCKRNDLDWLEESDPFKNEP